LRYSVWCSEEFPFEDRNAIAAQVSPAQGLGSLNLGTLPPEVCDAWQVPPAPAKENQPVVSSVPTLIMAGEFDPDTPPAAARTSTSFADAVMWRGTIAVASRWQPSLYATPKKLLRWIAY
jgi:hypothetical protein